MGSSCAAASLLGVQERWTGITLTEALADVWGQEAIPQPDGQVVRDARKITAMSLPGTLDPQMARSYLRLWCCPPSNADSVATLWSEAKCWSHHSEMKHPVFN